MLSQKLTEKKVTMKKKVFYIVLIALTTLCIVGSIVTLVFNQHLKDQQVAIDSFNASDSTRIDYMCRVNLTNQQAQFILNRYIEKGISAEWDADGYLEFHDDKNDCDVYYNRGWGYLPVPESIGGTKIKATKIRENTDTHQNIMCDWIISMQWTEDDISTYKTHLKENGWYDSDIPCDTWECDAVLYKNGVYCGITSNLIVTFANLSEY